MKRYLVYISEYSYKPEYKPAKPPAHVGEIPGWHKIVLANSRSEALDKCLPAIQSELSKLAGIYVSVFVGEKSNPSAYASRLVPIQIVISTGKRR